jgi:DNA polymerase-3 subunit alpha
MDEGVKDGAVVRMGGIIRSVKSITTKRGDPMAFVELEDIGGSVEMVVFTRVYSQVNDFLFADSPVFVQGEVQKNENFIKILAESIVPIDQAEAFWTASVHITIDSAKTDQSSLKALYDLLKEYPGKCQGVLHVVIPGKTETIIELPQLMNLRAGVSLTNEVNRLLGYKAVTTQCSPVESSPQIAEGRGKQFGRGKA